MSSSFESHRYFLAIIPPEPVLSEAQSLKEYFKEAYHSKASLNSPPHITLHMPFVWRSKKEALLIEKLTAFASAKHPFDLQLKGFNSFPPRVIYIDVIANTLLLLFQKDLERFCKQHFQLFNANRLDNAYHPHLTLAFRDLKKEPFALAWKEFQDKKFDATFAVNAFALLKHDGRIWNVLAEISLGGDTSS
jgi:2'-5' RNA ligase